jgi:hypothetical protein
MRRRSFGRVSVELPPGVHEVVAKMGNLSSKPVALTVSPDEDVELVTQVPWEPDAIELRRI